MYLNILLFCVFNFLTVPSLFQSSDSITSLCQKWPFCNLRISRSFESRSRLKRLNVQTLTFFYFFVPKHCVVVCRTFQFSRCCFSRSTPLHQSAYNGHLETCKVLVSSKADLAARNRCGRCRCCSRFSLNQSHPLACRFGRTALKDAMNQNKSDVVSFLRSVGAPQ